MNKKTVRILAALLIIGGISSPFLIDIYDGYKAELKAEAEAKAIADAEITRLAFEKQKIDAVESAKRSLEHRKESLKMYKGRYLNDPSDMKSLGIIVNISMVQYMTLTKLNRPDEAKEHLNIAIKYLNEYENAMAKGWVDESFREKNSGEIRSLIKFYHHLDKDMEKANKWRRHYLDHLMTKWNAGQNNLETACWIANMHGTLYTYTSRENKEERESWLKKSQAWYNEVIKTFPKKINRKRSCHLPAYF
jgi:hypothetical protein